MIVVVGGVKGGVGKTTIATNLAVLRAQTGKKLLLVDADEQKSTSIWAHQRSISGFKEVDRFSKSLMIENQKSKSVIPTNWVTIQLGGKAVYSEIEKMKLDYDDVIIDVGGRETRSLRAAMAVADVFIIPFKPSSLDIWTLIDVKSLISEMKPANPKLKCIAVINQAVASGVDNNEALDILHQCEEMICSPFSLGARKAFCNAASDGLGVVEMKTQDKKAVKEMKDFYDYIYTKCIENVHNLHEKDVEKVQIMYNKCT